MIMMKQQAMLFATQGLTAIVTAIEIAIEIAIETVATLETVGFVFVFVCCCPSAIDPLVCSVVRVAKRLVNNGLYRCHLCVCACVYVCVHVCAML